MRAPCESGRFNGPFERVVHVPCEFGPFAVHDPSEPKALESSAK